MVVLYCVSFFMDAIGMIIIIIILWLMVCGQKFGNDVVKKMPMETRWVKQNKWCEGKDDEESEQVCVRVNRHNVFLFSFWCEGFEVYGLHLFSFSIVHDA